MDTKQLIRDKHKDIQMTMKAKQLQKNCIMTKKGCKTRRRMNSNIVAGCYTSDFSLFLIA